jgi:hypothetical protein
MKPILCLLVASVWLFSCSSGLASKDLQGNYGVHLLGASKPYKEPLEWRLVLEDGNNFEFIHDGKIEVGYWAVRQVELGQPNLFFQTGQRTSLAIYTDSQITFLQPHLFFDSLITSVSFKRGN